MGVRATAVLELRRRCAGTTDRQTQTLDLQRVPCWIHEFIREYLAVGFLPDAAAAWPRTGNTAEDGGTEEARVTGRAAPPVGDGSKPAEVEVRLLGRVPAHRWAEPPVELPVSSQRLVAVLALHDGPGQDGTCPGAAGSLWPEKAEERAAGQMRAVGALAAELPAGRWSWALDAATSSSTTTSRSTCTPFDRWAQSHTG